MSSSEFRVEKSDRGYRVALYRNGQYYVTFVDGLSREGAVREALSLSSFWRRIGQDPAGAEVDILKRAS